MEVYIARLDKKIVYIGSGQNGRNNHVNSGTSHVYELNKLHFQGFQFDIEILGTNYDKETSLKLEKELIEKHQPLYNKTYKNKQRSEVAIKHKKLYQKIKDYYDKLYTEKKPNKREQLQFKKYSEQLLALIKEFQITEEPINIKFPVTSEINPDYKTAHRILIGENKTPEIYSDLFSLINIDRVDSKIPRLYKVSLNIIKL